MALHDALQFRIRIDTMAGVRVQRRVGLRQRPGTRGETSFVSLVGAVAFLLQVMD